MIIDYFDVETYGGIRGGMRDRDIDSRDVINVESKKSILEFGLKDRSNYGRSNKMGDRP